MPIREVLQTPYADRQCRSEALAHVIGLLQSERSREMHAFSGYAVGDSVTIRVIFLRTVTVTRE